MRTILVAAYAFSPTKGSEYGVGWNFITRLSKYYKIIVLYGTSGDRMGDTTELENYLQSNEIENVSFVKVAPGRMVRFFDGINHLGITLSFYVAYRIWQKAVYNKAREIIEYEDIALIHQLNTIGFSSPGYLWRIKKPFVWGPVGGTFTTPRILLGLLNKGERLKYLIRNLNINYTLKTSVLVKKVAARADGIFVATKDDQRNFANHYNRHALPIIPENNISFIAPKMDKPSVSSPVRLFWVGRIDGGKALILLIDALAKLPDHLLWHLDIAGDGRLADSLQKTAVDLGINHKITWHGAINRAESVSLMSRADLHVLTSMKDSNPTVLLEAVEMGIPTISLDHSGMSVIVREGQGIRIKIRGINEVIEDLAENIRHLLENPLEIIRMKEELRACQEHPTWDRAIDVVRDIYNKAILAYNGKI